MYAKNRKIIKTNNKINIIKFVCDHFRALVLNEKYPNKNPPTAHWIGKKSPLPL
jgi:hypothetical protein